jgi:hypothetical protein
MSNINNNNFHNLKLRIINDEYWDFFLNKDDIFGNSETSGLTTQCLISYIDINNNDCHVNNKLYSLTDYRWKDAINDGIELNNIGYTGVDNGLIQFQKDRITNEEFYELFTNSKLDIQKDDTRFFLNQVSGNTQIYSYPSKIETINGNSFLKLQGGFYQGFFKLYQNKYQVLPTNLDNDWQLEFVIRPQDYETNSDILNRNHADTDGLFFYIGTRAENKFWYLYNHEEDNFPKNCLTHYDDGFTTTLPDKDYVDSGYTCDYINDKVTGEYTDLGQNVLKDTYLEPEIIEEPEPEAYVSYQYFHNHNCPPKPVLEYVDDSYLNVDQLEQCNQPKKDNCCAIPYPFWFNTYCSDPITNFQSKMYDDCGCINTKNDNEEDIYVRWDAGCCDNKCEDCYETKNDKCCGIPYPYWFNTYQTDTSKLVNIENCGCKTSCKQDKNGYFICGYMDMTDYTCEAKYVEDGYIGEQMSLENLDLRTFDDYPLNLANIYEIKSDNKFLLFNRTKTGYTVNTYKGEEVIFTGTTRNFKGNLFLLLNRTKTGYTTNTINKLIEKETNKYNLRYDLYYNCLGLRIKNDGSIGYRMLIKDCENDEPLAMIEEYSKPNMIIKSEWNIINVRVSPLTLNSQQCNYIPENAKMKLYFYVNGKLVFISKEIPILRLKELQDIPEKQEGVPYNISLGGGTQGLCDMITIDYYDLPEYILPIEKYFAGTFIGDIKSFKFYNCRMNYNEISNNFIFEENNQK